MRHLLPHAGDANGGESLDQMTGRGELNDYCAIAISLTLLLG